MITVFNTKQTFKFIKDVNDITDARINIVQVVNTVDNAVNDLKESIMFGKPVNQSFKQIGQVESSLVNAMTMCINLKFQALLTDCYEDEKETLDSEIIKINDLRNKLEDLQAETQKAEGLLNRIVNS